MAQGKGGRKFIVKRRIDAFWKKVRIKGPDDCWEWLGASGENAYGRFHDGERCRSAHAFAYEIANGKLPDGYYACHKCDNPSCCNPTHIFAGTPTQNQLDCVQKGRKNVTIATIEANAKFTQAQIIEIRNDARNHSVVARVYGVDRATIRNIRSRKSWSHIP